MDVESSLKELRAAVAAQVPELMPAKFLFIENKIEQISRSAEDFVIINTITARNNDGNLTVCFSDICPPKQVETESVSNDGSKIRNDNCGQQESYEQNNDKTSVNQALKSPTSWSLRGVKVFTNKEIEDAVGKEKHRRIFWNKRAKELSRTQISKAKIYEKIHADWRLQKSENLLEQGRADVKLADKAANDSPSTEAGVKRGTLQKNIARVEMYKTEYTKLSNEVKELLVGKPSENVKKLSDLRARLTFSPSFYIGPLPNWGRSP